MSESNTRYKKIKALGKGGFANVYLVKDRFNHDRPLVLKVMDLTSMGKPEQAMAKKEVEILSSLHHKHIIGYCDNFHAKGRLHIAMEHAAGGDLWQRIRAQGSRHFSENQICLWFYQICSALDYLHKSKIFHRDLKPQNVFLTQNGDVKLGDFGVSKVMNSQAMAHTQIGTPFYISPEICQNKPYDSKSDIWSLGCLVFELCALKPPFIADDMKAMMKKICYTSAPPISASFSVGLAESVTSMMHKQPRKRPSASRLLKRPLLAQHTPKPERNVELDDGALPQGNRAFAQGAVAPAENSELKQAAPAPPLLLNVRQSAAAPQPLLHQAPLINADEVSGGAAADEYDIFANRKPPSFRENKNRRPAVVDIAPAPPEHPEPIWSPRQHPEPLELRSPPRARRHSFDGVPFSQRNYHRGVKPVAKSLSPVPSPKPKWRVPACKEPPMKANYSDDIDYQCKLPKLAPPPVLQYSEPEPRHYGLHPQGRSNRKPLQREHNFKLPADRYIPYLDHQLGYVEKRHRKRRSSI